MPWCWIPNTDADVPACQAELIFEVMSTRLALSSAKRTQLIVSPDPYLEVADPDSPLLRLVHCTMSDGVA